MTTKNNRNARFLLSSTLGGAYTAVTKAHGLKMSVPTEFSDDTGYGQKFHTALPGLQDFKATLLQWYDTVYTTLEAMSLNKISEYFLAYPDFADTLNYYRGQCYVGLNEHDMDLGNTGGLTFDVVLTNEDLQIIRQGVAL